jgi:hypothetical protein
MSLGKNGPPSKVAVVSDAVGKFFQAVTGFFSPKKAIDNRINALNADLAKAVVDSNIPLDPARLAEFRSAQAEVARLQKEVDAIVDAKVTPKNVVLTRAEFAELASIMRSLEGRINELNDLVGAHKSESELARQEISRLETLNKVWETKAQQQRQQEQQLYVPLPPAPLQPVAPKPKPAQPYLAINQPALDEEDEEDEEEEEEEDDEEDEEEVPGEADENLVEEEREAYGEGGGNKASKMPVTPVSRNKKKKSSSSRKTTNGVNKRKSPTPRVTHRTRSKPKKAKPKPKSKSASAKPRPKTASSSAKKRQSQSRRKVASAKSGTKHRRGKSSTKRRAK